MGFLLFEKVLESGVSAEIILGRSPLFLYPLAPLQLYPVSRGYKGTVKGMSDMVYSRSNPNVEKPFLKLVNLLKHTVVKCLETSVLKPDSQHITSESVKKRAKVADKHGQP